MADEPELVVGGGGGETVLSRLLEDEMRESFIDYSMSVIVQRALPDVRDGLKPVHRRILYAMSELGLGPGRAYKKSATVVGDVLGKYHPHGDSAVYDSMVRMVQPFSLRYPLVDGQGNFGSVDGDSAAAYRYTEARLQRLALELVEDIDKDTVAFADNFDGSIQEPTVLPSKFPNLLVNGSSGIAVGMATNIPPHNLREINDAVAALIDNPDLPQEHLEHIVKGPDFPTGGYVCGREGIRDAYRTGRGRVVMRARADIEEIDANSERIVVREIPFMVNKSRLIEQIANLVRDKKITEIRDMRDESDRDGMRIVIELKRDAVPHIVLNKLYKHTQMQSTFGTILLALVDGQPKIMALREMLQHFITHRMRVIVRRSEFDLAKALDREHILEGLKIAVDNIDEVIKIIRAADDTDQASTQLQETFELSERQAKAILDMRLARLTGLEIEKLEEELAEVRAQIEALREILGSEERRSEILKNELAEISEKYGDERRTEIIGAVGDFNVEDLIVEEDMVITVSHKGYVKRLPVDTYRAQRRGGRGLRGMDTKEEDWVEHLFVASTHDYIMIFTRAGQCYWLKVWEIPVGGRTSRGKPIVNLLNLGSDESIASVVPVREFSEDRYLLFCTRNGVVKKTELSAYGNVRAVGLNAINIREGDELIDVRITEGDDEIILASREGMAIRFKEGDVRTTGRATEGVRGLDLAEGDVVVGMVVVREDSTLLVVSEKGMGKRTAVDAYRMQRRGGKGVINLRISKKTGKVVSIKSVRDEEQLMLITRKGVVNRQSVGEINVIGRATQGVKLMNLDEGDQVVDVAWVIIGDEEEEDEAVEAAVQIAEEQAAAERAGARTPRSLGRDEDEDELDDDELDGDGDDLEDDFEDEDFGDDGLDDEDDA
jgi:DNA gyrase subunit A